MNKKYSIAISGMMLLLASTLTFAAGEVKGDKLKQLVTGKTVHAKHLLKGFSFSVYFDPDGKTALRKQNGKTTTTSYKFQGDKHCIFWKGQDRCANVVDNGDGTYSRVNPAGKKIISWTKIETGKKL